MKATGGQKAGFLQWRTYQMSDHLPMWCELKLDFSQQYLNDLKQGKPVEKPEGAPAEPIRSARRTRSKPTAKNPSVKKASKARTSRTTRWRRPFAPVPGQRPR
jgi:hypothetical protein